MSTTSYTTTTPQHRETQHDRPDSPRLRDTHYPRGPHRRAVLRGQDVGINDEIVIAVDLAVVIEVAELIAKDAAALQHVRVDPKVIVAVQFTVQIGVAAPGVHHEHVAAVDG